MAKHIIKLKIADVVIQIQSDFEQEQFTAEERRLQAVQRFDNFFYSGSGPADILINVKIADKLPQIHNARRVFITYHFENGRENWRLLKKDDTYIYKCSLDGKKQLMLINSAFDKVTAWLLPKEKKGRVWAVTDIIYDFLQVLLINYFALSRTGIFTHSIGVKDVDGKGLLFAGKSGAGKSTTARLWHRHSRATVLNDDRIIVRRRDNKFYIHGSPWHGEFSDYLESRIESAPLEKLYFIHHAAENRIRRLSGKEAFSFLYPALFPAFWDKGCLENIVSFSQDLINDVGCYSLGFVRDKKVIGFVRSL